MKKRLSLLMVLMMVLSLVPMSAFAAAGSVPGGVLSFDDNESAISESVTVKLTQAAYTNITSGRIAKLTLSNGAEFNGTQAVVFNSGGEATVTPGTITGTVTPDPTFASVAYLNLDQDITVAKDDMDVLLNLKVDFDELDAGDVTLTVSEMNSSKFKVADPIKVAVIKEATTDEFKMVVTDSAKKIGMDGGTLSKVEIKDFDTNTNKLTLELPDYLSWSAATFSVSVDGTSVIATRDASDTEKATLTIPVGSDSVLLEPVVSVDRRNASNGDITLKVTAEGGEKQTASETIGQIVGYDVTMTAVEKGEKEIPALYGGEKATIKVKLSGVAGSFSANRVIDFTVEGADVTYGKVNPSSDFSATVLGDDDDGIFEDGEFTLTNAAGASTDKTLEFEMEIVTDYAHSGEVVLTADSRDFGTLECEVAKVTPAFTVEVAKVTDIKKGESLATADIVIKEAKAGILDSDQYLVLNLNDKNRETLSFASDYTVEGTNGLKLDDGIYNEEGGSKNALSTLVIDLKSSSVKEAGVITISDVVVNVDGATVDGVKTLDVYVVEDGQAYNDKATPDTVSKMSHAVMYVDFAEPDAEYEVNYVNVVKEYGAVATTTVFVIGSKTYTVNGVEMTANEAPYVAGKGYTMLPVRALAESLGLKADWNSNTKTATFSNDSKVASVTLGASTMYVNGTPIPLNAKAEIKNGSTFVELRSLAAAFSVNLEWDAATKTVKVIG